MLNKLSLRSQITLLCTGLILVTVITLLITFWVRTSAFSQLAVNQKMASAEHVLEEYLLAKERLLITAARVLTSDFGFKQAVATRDNDTIVSVLENHGDRIHADLMILIGLEGEVLSVSPAQMSNSRELYSKIRQLPLGSDHSQFLSIDASLYQLMILPVKAPHLIAYSIVGFKISSEAMAELKNLTGVEVSLLGDSGAIYISTFPDQNYLQQLLHGSMAGHAGVQSLSSYQSGDDDNSAYNFTDGSTYNFTDDYEHKAATLTKLTGISALLSASLEAEHRAFNQLLLSIALGGSAILIAALLFAQLLVSGITRPLRHLVKLTKIIAKGGFDMAPASGSSALEFQELNQAFYKMGDEIKSREKEIKFQAEHDMLTGLHNRHAFLMRLDQWLAADVPVLLMAVNIRRFKQVNDTMGPDIGDAVLELVAARIGQFMAVADDFKKECFAARIDADNFLIACRLADANMPELLLIAALEKFQAVLADSYVIDDLRLSLNIVIGWLRVGEAIPAKDLLRRLTIAMSYTKKERVQLRGYRAGEDEEYLYRLKVIEALKVAMDSASGELFLHYQPKLNLLTQKIDKVEVLIRWNHQEFGFISPELFVGLAEQSGLIVRLTRWIVHTALAQIAAWSSAGYQLQVAINVSAQDITEPEFIKCLLGELAATGVAATNVTVEITERDLMEHEDLAVACLSQLRACGIKVSVDDYGIGQSSLAKLKQLPVDELKIDKSFILNLASSIKDQDIVSSTIDLGHKLGMKVVAEGVEDEASLVLLQAMQCDYIQGYFLARPMSSAALLEWIDAYPATH